MASNYQNLEKLEKMVAKEFSINSKINIWTYSAEELKMSQKEYTVYLDMWARKYGTAGHKENETATFKVAHKSAINLLEKMLQEENISEKEFEIFKECYQKYYIKQNTELNLFNKEMSNIAPLSNLYYLDAVNIARTQVSDISPVAGLIKLRALNFCQTQVSEISPVSELKNLTMLNLYKTNVLDISSLINLPNLKEIYLEENYSKRINVPNELISKIKVVG